MGVLFTERKIAAMKTALFIMIGLVLCICTGAFAADTDLIREPSSIRTDQSASGERDGYSGTLRIYLVEPDSRYYNNADGEPRLSYDYGLLKFMEVTVLNLADGESYYNEVETIYSSLSQTNIAAQAVLFNSEGFQADACDDKGSCWFTAYPVDNAAMAEIGVPGSPPTGAGFTHPVFVEEGTAGWCPPCRYLIPALGDIFRSGDYPMFFAALVDDQSSVASIRLGELNLHYFPTSYTDGGRAVHVGGSSDVETILRNAIVAAGAQPVDEVDVVIALDWINISRVLTRVRVAAGVPANVTPDLPAAPICEPVATLNEPFEITVTGTDADGDDVYYNVNWGEDRGPASWEGPYPSGDPIVLSHTYQADGSYAISVQVQDVWNFVSEWSPTSTTTFDCCVMKGDINYDGSGPMIDDLIYLVTYMFQDGPVLPCMDHADVDYVPTEIPDIADLIYLVQYMFQDGPDFSPCPY
jgi:hypothetical protein